MSGVAAIWGDHDKADDGGRTLLGHTRHRGGPAQVRGDVMELHEIVPWGRSFGEYRRMFSLRDGDLAGRTLGCGDGPASFNAEATAAGLAVVSCDPIYAFAAEDIRRRVEATYDSVMSQVRRHPERFVWDAFRDPDDLGRRRLTAMDCFLGDFERGKEEGRYVPASLPGLPFEAGIFSPSGFLITQISRKAIVDFFPKSS